MIASTVIVMPADSIYFRLVIYFTRCNDSTIIIPIAWNVRGDVAYKMFHEPKSHRDAELHCASFGPNVHLASVHTTAENEFLLALSPDVYERRWLGGMGSSASNFAWNDNSCFEYSNWAPTEPQLIANVTRCLQLGYPAVAANSFWASVNCETPLAYICEAAFNGTSLLRELSNIGDFAALGYSFIVS
jgi:hypothetical protein